MKLVDFHGRDIYELPACYVCDRDALRIVDVPEPQFFGPRKVREIATCILVHCGWCDQRFNLKPQDDWRAREPERLKARLAELRAGGWR